MTTKERILQAGLKMWPYISANAIARELGLSGHAAILYHFPKLRDAIAYHAVDVGDKRVIGYLTLEGHRAVKSR